MTLHVFANFVTPFGTAANNRAETEGNMTTLQKLLWMGETHSTVSAEAIRFALRRRLAMAGGSASEVVGPAFMGQQCLSTAAPRIGPVGDLRGCPVVLRASP